MFTSVLTKKAPISNSLSKTFKYAALIASNKTRFSTSTRFQSNTNNPSPTNPSPNPPFYIEDHKDEGYVIFKLNKQPANTLNLEFLTELNIQMEKFEQSKDFNGVILTSTNPNIFSAGLDIMEMYQAKPDRVRQFWVALQDFWLKLYGSNKVYVAAINGHSPAGGCLMSMSCDYRLMSKGLYKIGLNETLLGIKAPSWFRDTMINTIGFRETEKALQLGKLYSPEEALSVGLVDEICEPKELLSKAQEQIKSWVKIPTVARELTKSSLRRDTLNKLISQREADVEEFAEFCMKDSVQKSLGHYLESLKASRKPKK